MSLHQVFSAPQACVTLMADLSKYEAGELIRRRREAKGLRQEDVVEHTTVPNAGYLSNLESGNTNVARSKHLRSIARYLGLTEDEIRSISPLAVFEQPATPPLTPAMQPRLIAHAGTIGAGYNPRMHALDYPEKRWMPNHPALEGYRDEDLMTLDVVGDSMADDVSRTTVPEGSTVYLHIRLEPQPGDIVAVWLEKEHVAVLKIFSGNGTHVVLRSYNDHHPPIVLSPDDHDVVQGVYLAHLAGGRRAHNAKVKYRK